MAKFKLFFGKTRSSFKNPKYRKYWHTLTGMLILTLFLAAPNIQAAFLRLSGDSGFGFGFGYDTEEGEFGYGYGYLFEDFEDGEFVVSESNLSLLATSGIVSIEGTNPTSTNSATFNADTQINVNITGIDASISIPSGAEFTKTGGGAFDLTALTASNEGSNVSGIVGFTSQGAIQFGIPNFGITSSLPITISIPVPASLNGETLSIYHSSNANTGWSLLVTCDVADGLCTFTTNTFSFFAATTPQGGGGGGGGGGGSGAAPMYPTTPFNGVPTVPAPSAPELVVTPPESAMVPADVSALLAFLGVPRNTANEQKSAKDITADFKEFGLKISATAQLYGATNFVAYGNSVAAQKLGMGERRAMMRDYMDTVRKIPTSQADWNDVQRIITGSKPVGRNLNQEKTQLTKVLDLFVKLYGRRPDFKNAQHDLVWNYMMYRIRPAVRHLPTEAEGVGLFRNRLKRTPTSPQDWAAVKALGYVLR